MIEIDNPYSATYQFDDTIHLMLPDLQQSNHSFLLQLDICSINALHNMTDDAFQKLKEDLTKFTYKSLHHLCKYTKTDNLHYQGLRRYDIICIATKVVDKSQNQSKYIQPPSYSDNNSSISNRVKSKYHEQTSPPTYIGNTNTTPNSFEPWSRPVTME